MVFMIESEDVDKRHTMMFTSRHTVSADASFTSPLFTVYEHPLEARRWKRRKESMARGRRMPCDLYVADGGSPTGDETNAPRGMELAKERERSESEQKDKR